MSRVKQLIDEGESIRPRSMANQMERLPSLRAAEDEDSMLNNVDNGGETLPDASAGDAAGKKKMSFSGSIMANVMERANSRSAAAAAAASSSSRASHPGAAGTGAGGRGGGKKRKARRWRDSILSSDLISIYRAHLPKHCNLRSILSAH